MILLILRRYGGSNITHSESAIGEMRGTAAVDRLSSCWPPYMLSLVHRPFSNERRQSDHEAVLYELATTKISTSYDTGLVAAIYASAALQVYLDAVRVARFFYF